jgi:hypothetical protein
LIWPSCHYWRGVWQDRYLIRGRPAHADSGQAAGQRGFYQRQAGTGHKLQGDKLVEVAVKYGSFIQHVIDFSVNRFGAFPSG